MSNHLPTDYQSFIHTSRYARWLEEYKRREGWGETVSRYMTNVVVPKTRDEIILDEIEEAILGLEIMPSMRAVMTAGPALERDNTAGYNCSYLPVDDPKSFDEAMFILLCGTGVGFSVERQYISKLPEVPEQLFASEDVIVLVLPLWWNCSSTRLRSSRALLVVSCLRLSATTLCVRLVKLLWWAVFVAPQ
jgi:ribonucleoside-triphosphate reductase